MSQKLAYIPLTGLFGLFGLPFVIPWHTVPMPAFYTEWCAAACGLVVVLAVLMRPQGATISAPRPLFLFVFPALLILGQWVGKVALFPGGAQLAILSLLLASLLVVASAQLKQSFGLGRLSTLIAWSLLISGAINALVACMQHWGVQLAWMDTLIVHSDTSRPFGNLTQANHFSAHMAMALAALLYLSSHARIHVLPASALAVTILVGLALSGSRSAWLYLGAFLLLAYAYKREFKTAKANRLWLYALAAFPIFLLVQQGLSLLAPHTVTASTRFTEHAGGGLLGIRLAMWEDAWRAFLSKPLTGTGYQGLAWRHFLNQADMPNPLYSRFEDNHLENAHNIIFHLLAEFGIGGGLLVILAGYWLFITYRRTLSPERWFILAALSVIVLHSQVEYPLHFMHFLAPAAILMALADTSSFRLQASRGMVATVAMVSLLVGGSLLAMLFSNYRALEEVHKRAESGRVTMDLRTRALLAAGERGGFFSSQVSDFVNGIQVSASEPASWGPLLVYSQEAVRYQTKATYVYRHVLLLALNGEQQQADQFLKLALNAYPNSRPRFEQQVLEMLEAEPNNHGLQALRRQLSGIERLSGAGRLRGFEMNKSGS